MNISIKLILQELVRRVWIIIICAILGLAIAFTYTKFFVAPVYTTSMKVSALTNLLDDESISSVGSYINMMTLAERRVETYIVLMDTTAFYDRVAQTSGTGYTSGAVASMLKFKQVDNMGIFTVSVTGTNPQAVKAIADAVAQEMWPFIETYQTHTTITVIEPPVLPTTPINQTMQSNCASGVLIGALLSAGIIALIAFFDTHIKDEKTLTQRYNIPVLGSIPDFTVITTKKKRK